MLSRKIREKAVEINAGNDELGDAVRILHQEQSELRATLESVNSKLDSIIQAVELKRLDLPTEPKSQSSYVEKNLRSRIVPHMTLLEFLHIISDALQTSSIPKRRLYFGKRWRLRFNYALFIKKVASSLRRRQAGKAVTLYKVAKPALLHLNRPRILHAIPNVHVGGSTQLIVDLMSYIGNKFDMHIMTSSFPTSGVHEGMIIHDLSEPTSVASMLELMKLFQPHIIHVHYWGDVDTPWYEKVFSAAKMFGAPVIQNINTPISPYAYSGKSALIYVSKYVQENFRPTVDTNEEFVIYPGIDLQMFSNEKKISKDAFDSIGMVYRLEKDKLNIDSINVFIEVVKRRPETRVFIIGGGSFFEPYLEQVVSAGVRDNFVFTGYVQYDELPRLYSQFSVFVAPVWKESFGQVAPFAMYMGRVVAGYNIGALSEILESEETLAGTTDELAEKIVSLLNNKSNIIQIGEKNRELAKNKYSVQAMCESYNLVYSRILRDQSVDPMPNWPRNVIF